MDIWAQRGATGACGTNRNLEENWTHFGYVASSPSEPDDRHPNKHWNSQPLWHPICPCHPRCIRV